MVRIHFPPAASLLRTRSDPRGRKPTSVGCWSRRPENDNTRIIRYLRRNRVELALVRERLSLEGLEDDIDAFLEQFAVLVDQRGAEALYLARMISAGDTEDHPPAAEDVGHRVVFGEAQRVPLNQAAPL